MKQLNFLGLMNANDNVDLDIFDYRPAIFSRTESDRYLGIFMQQVPWVQITSWLYDKQVITPRLTAWFGDAGTNNSVSRQRNNSIKNISNKDEPVWAWTAELLDIKMKVELISGLTFNSVLLNYYRDGNDSVAWHSDRGIRSSVASVSFGQERAFDLRRKDDHSKQFTILLEQGSYLLMKEKFQEDWEHRIAKSKTMMKPRINLTFRNRS